MLTKPQFENEKNYETTMSIIRTLRKQGIVSEDEYKQIDTIFLRKYEPILGNLYSENA